MSEIGLTTDEYLERLEKWGVIEMAPDKSELFLTEKVQSSLEKAEVTLVSKENEIPFRDNGDTELTTYCCAAAVAHLESATPEDIRFLADFLFKFLKAQIAKGAIEDQVIRPGIKWPKKAAEG